MGQRQVRNIALVHIHLHALGGAGYTPCHGVEGVHHAFGFARGARGVDDGADLVTVGHGLTPHGNVGAYQIRPLQCCHGRGQRKRHQGQARGRATVNIADVIHLPHKQGLGAAVLQDVGQCVGIEGGVDRYRHIPRHDDGQVRQYPVCAVFANDGHTASLRPALRLQPTRHAAHLLRSLRPCNVQHHAIASGLGQVDLLAALFFPAVEALQRQIARGDGDRIHGHFPVDGGPILGAHPNVGNGVDPR